MKKFLFAIAVCALGFASCESGNSDNGGNLGGGEITPPVLTEGVVAEAYYGGADDNEEYGSYWINFYPEDQEVDDFGDLSDENGYILCISFQAPLSANPDYAALVSGEYAGSENGGNMTFAINNEDATYLTRMINGETVQAPITGGSINLKYSQGVYEINCDLKLANDESYEYAYVGKIIFHNRTEEGMYTTLTEDRAVTGLSQGYVELMGESLFEGAKSDIAVIVLGDDNFDIVSLLGKGNGVTLYLNIPVGATEIPDGKYEMALSGNEIPAYTLVPGMLSGIYLFGCWYFQGQDEAALCNGTVDITHADNIYNISFELKDGYNHTVKGSYSGELYE